MSRNFICRFSRDENGAVTVDWVVLTAGLIIFGVLVASSIIGGATNMSTGMGAKLGEAEVPQVSWD
ncbi:hypothetical protein FHG66_15690 [Rubellimicrobium rubrum]|uniref:Pilus assembly protein n=1 Tax=Rubellimicrobium rubrum TaxID=2585369 RepID=A0A5C4MUM4_9RHOB|nr:hypothetical protein [Rubellimicrobium rubrum]TNC47812.1 hypothetical protein FHG66_15690 [Rubellimicrobium rubrum]